MTDNEEIQKLINENDTVVLDEARTYNIDSTKPLVLGSNQEVDLNKSTLISKGTAGNRSIFTIPKVTNVTIRNGTLVGSGIYTGSAFEIGIRVDGSINVKIEKVISSSFRTDGFWVGNQASAIIFDNVIANSNGRNGLSAVSVSGLEIKNSIFNESKPGILGAGVDIEPNQGDFVSYVRIDNCKFAQNVIGLYILAGQGRTERVTVTNCMSRTNTKFGLVANSIKKIKFISNIVESSMATGAQAMSIGGVDGNLCEDVELYNNTIMPKLKLAGVKNIKIVGNKLQYEAVALGINTEGDVHIFGNEVL